MQQHQTDGADAARRIDAVVIGAGLAGLAAADGLVRAGRETVILEASDRIGGRTFGARWDAADREIDLGGTWLLPSFATARGLLAELGIGTWQSPASDLWLTHLSDGPRERITLDAEQEEALRAANDRIAEARAAAPAGLSAADALDAVPMPALVRDWHVATQRYLSGCALEDVDSGHLLVHHDDLMDPEHYATQISGTTRALADALAARSGAEIRFGRPVVAVRRESDGWRVVAGDGTELVAASVVVAVPRNLLGSIAFEPALAELSAPLAEMAAAPHAGASRKDWFVLDGVDRHFRVFASEGAFGYFRSEAILPGGGVLAVALAPQSEGVLAVPELEEAVRTYLPEASIRAHTRHDWLADEWARGTWVAPRPGDYERIAAVEAAAPGLRFVGGDLSKEFPGTIEGALRTGYDAAASLG